MKKEFVLLLLSFIIIQSCMPNTQWKNSLFFQDKRQSGYTVYLQTKESYPLSKEDSQMLIDILAAYNWEENKHKKTPELEMKVISWGRYHYYIHDYYIDITHPGGRKIRIGVNGGGIAKDEFLIEHSNGNTYGVLRFNEYLSSDDIEKIKQLFFKYNVNFNSISSQKDEAVKITPIFEFYNGFYIDLPPVTLDKEQSEQFIGLYNSGWNNSAHSFEGGSPMPQIYIYANHNVVSYGDNVLMTQYPNDFTGNLEFKDADKQKLKDLVNTALTAHDGEDNRTLENYRIKIYYQYKDGLLHGQVKIYTLDNKLTNEFIYEKGLPISYIQYSDKGTKVKEIHFSPEDLSSKWTEYDEKGKIKDKGESDYRIFHYRFDEADLFYKGK